MKKQLEIRYLKKADKFLKKNQNIISKDSIDELIISIIETIGYRGDIYKK